MNTAIVYVLASVGRNRRLFFLLGLASFGKVAAMASAGNGVARCVRIPVDENRYCHGRARLRPARKRLYRVVHLLALGRRGRAARPLGRNRRGRCTGRCWHHRLWCAQLVLERRRLMIHNGRPRRWSLTLERFRDVRYIEEVTGNCFRPVRAGVSRVDPGLACYSSGPSRNQDQRGDMMMGFDQARTTHHFLLFTSR